MKSALLKQVIAWLPVVLWAYMIFRFSSGIVPVASSIFWQDFAVKKTGHMILFGFLALFIYRALRLNSMPRKKATVISILLATLYGATDEVHQMFTQGRESRVRDIFIDGLGASLVMYIVYDFYSKLPKKIRTFLLELGIN